MSEYLFSLIETNQQNIYQSLNTVDLETLEIERDQFNKKKDAINPFTPETPITARSRCMFSEANMKSLTSPTECCFVSKTLSLFKD